MKKDLPYYRAFQKAGRRCLCACEECPDLQHAENLGLKKKWSGSDDSELIQANESHTQDSAQTQTWFTVKQLAEVEPAFSQASLRNLIFKASPRYSTKGEIPGNGLIEAGAIKRVGGKVLIHHARFLAWIEQQGSKGGAA